MRFLNLRSTRGYLTAYNRYENSERSESTSDVKRGQNLEAEAKATRPRPRPGQFLEVEAKAEAKTK